jgi:hypothetical protein
MKAKSSWFAALTICLLLPASSAFAGNIDVTIRDRAPLPYIYFGTGDASVTYSGVVFSQQAALSNGNFFIIGVLFSADPAVLSSQEQTSGVSNILSKGDFAVLTPSGSGYAVPNFSSTKHLSFDMKVVPSPADVVGIHPLPPSVPVPDCSNLAMLLGFGVFNLAAVFGFRRKLT